MKQLKSHSYIDPYYAAQRLAKKRKRKLLWLIPIAFLIFGAICSCENTKEIESKKAASTQEATPPAVPKEYSDNCPVDVTAQLSSDIIGQPEITCNIKK